MCCHPTKSVFATCGDDTFVNIFEVTGDKLETAENIAKSCNLIQSRFEIMKYSLPSDMENVVYLKNLVSKANDMAEK